MAALAAGPCLMQQRLSLQRRPMAAPAARPKTLGRQRLVSAWHAVAAVSNEVVLR
jgi:hypothetical protein